MSRLSFPAVLGFLAAMAVTPVLAAPAQVPPQHPGLAKPFAGMAHPTPFSAQGPHCPPPFTPAQLQAVKCSVGLASGFSLTDWKGPLKATLPEVEAALRKAGFVVQPFTPPAVPKGTAGAAAAKSGVLPSAPGAVLLVSRPHWQQNSTRALWQSMALSPVAVDLVQVQGLTWSVFGKRSFLALHSPAFGLAQSFDAKLKAALRSVPGSLYPHQKQTAPAK